MTMKGERRDLTPRYFRIPVHLIRPFPDFDFSFIRPVRQRAVELLHLAQGGRVLDMGCGPGGSFPHLVRAVGPSGEVVGVEISPEVAMNARRRIEKNQWTNVRVIEASAQAVDLTGLFDGVLMFAAQEVFASQEAMENILPHLRSGARIVVFGAKTSRRRMGWVLNSVLRTLFSKLSFPTTPLPDDEPWRVVANLGAKLDIDEYFFGWLFLAWGALVPGSLVQERCRGVSP
jgi:SAM-dependent methyltransferase